jgi:MazG family protein
VDDERLAEEIRSLRGTLRTLRGEGGCPWDRERSLGEMVSYLIDEAYELLHAEKSGDLRHLEEELGDVLFIVVFIHELMLEKARTDLSSILERAHGKIISRHPHVFGDREAETSRESLAEWDRIKKGEKVAENVGRTLSDIPGDYPPIKRALALQKKAAGVGFDWPDHEGVLQKLGEEIEELQKAVDSNDRDHVREEIGDILFTVVNLARMLDVDCDNALEGTSAKFRKRFDKMEEMIVSDGLDLLSLPLDEMEKYWQRSKTGIAGRDK